MILTFQELHAEVAAHYAREAAERLPAARAVRALETLRDALDEMGTVERGEVVDEIRTLVACLDDRSWELTQDLATLPF